MNEGAQFWTDKMQRTKRWVLLSCFLLLIRSRLSFSRHPLEQVSMSTKVKVKVKVKESRMVMIEGCVDWERWNGNGLNDLL